MTYDEVSKKANAMTQTEFDQYRTCLKKLILSLSKTDQKISNYLKLVTLSLDFFWCSKNNTLLESEYEHLSKKLYELKDKDIDTIFNNMVKYQDNAAKQGDQTTVIALEVCMFVFMTLFEGRLHEEQYKNFMFEFLERKYQLAFQAKEITRLKKLDTVSLEDWFIKQINRWEIEKLQRKN